MSLESAIDSYHNQIKQTIARNESYETKWSNKIVRKAKIPIVDPEPPIVPDIIFLFNPYNGQRKNIEGFDFTPKIRSTKASSSKGPGLTTANDQPGIEKIGWIKNFQSLSIKRESEFNIKNIILNSENYNNVTIKIRGIRDGYPDLEKDIILNTYSITPVSFTDWVVTDMTFEESIDSNPTRDDDAIGVKIQVGGRERTIYQKGLVISKIEYKDGGGT